MLSTRRILTPLLLVLLASCDPAAGDADSGPTPATDAGSGCNTIAQAGSPVPEVAGAGTMPSPAGGVIADGTYVLTSFEIYPPGSVDPFQRTETFVFAGGTMESISRRDSGPEERRSATYSTSGTTWSVSLTCPGTQSVEFEYTATPTTFQIFEIGADTNEVHTYTKL